MDRLLKRFRWDRDQLLGTLHTAAMENNINKIRELLDQGVEPEYPTVVNLAITRHNKEIIKLLIQRRTKVNTVTIKYIYEYSPNIFELLTQILDYTTEITVFLEIFINLTKLRWKLSPSEREFIFKLLLRKGLPVNGFIKNQPAIDEIRVDGQYYSIAGFVDTYTLLHLSIQSRAADFVRKLCIF